MHIPLYIHKTENFDITGTFDLFYSRRIFYLPSYVDSMLLMARNL